MSVTIASAAIVGLEGARVDVEVDVLTSGNHVFTIVGLPDASVRESRERVSSAVKNSSFRPAHFFGRMTANLAPADLPKASPIYDVPIALGILAETRQITCDFAHKLFVGELALDGTVRRVRGILPIVLFAREEGFREVYVPAVNAQEARMVGGIVVYAVASLQELTDHLTGKKTCTPLEHKPVTTQEQEYIYDMRDVKGQDYAKRALEIAAAGGHNVLFHGPPGSGKTLLAKSFVSILPLMQAEEVLDVSKIYSVAGMLSTQEGVQSVRPFRAPHHSASTAALIGGGSVPRPGEISLAHRGVLFLDEFAELPRQVMETLRQPLEDGMVTITRARGTSDFPAQFTLIAAMNPCPCGFATDPERACVCTSAQRAQYAQKISGPILDRIDLHVEVPRIAVTELEQLGVGESSAKIRTRVEAARGVQRKRFAKTATALNAEMQNKELRQYATLDDASRSLLRSAAEQYHLSARAYHRIVKVARTIADVEGAKTITPAHIAEAVQYRVR